MAFIRNTYRASTRHSLAAIQENPLCRIWLTAFSNIYILKQWATAYHKDSNNHPGVLTAITAFGTFSGGELVLPRWSNRRRSQAR